jgi:hypothetical protein
MKHRSKYLAVLIVIGLFLVSCSDTGLMGNASINIVQKPNEVWAGQQ